MIGPSLPLILDLSALRDAAQDTAGPGDPTFAALLGNKAAAIEPADRRDLPAPGTTRATGPQNRRKSAPDPSLQHDLTALAVSELATQGPVKATVAAASHQQTAPSAPSADHSGAERRSLEAEQALPARSTRDQPARPIAAGAPTTGAHQAAPSSSDSGAGAAPQTTECAAAANQIDASARASGSAPNAGIPASAQQVAAGAVQAAEPVASATAVRPAAQNSQPVTPINALKAASAAERTLKPESKAAPSTPRFTLERDDRLAAQAARGLAAALRQGDGSVTMRLQPEALGDLRIRVDLAQGRVEATFEVQTDQARQLLHTSLSDLRTALEARGLEVDRLDVRVADRSGETPHAHDHDRTLGGAGGESGNGGAGHEQSPPRQDARGGSPPGTTFGVERTPPSPLAEMGPAHGARLAQSVMFIEPGGDPLMRVRLDAVA